MKKSFAIKWNFKNPNVKFFRKIFFKFFIISFNTIISSLNGFLTKMLFFHVNLIPLNTVVLILELSSIIDSMIFKSISNFLAKKLIARVSLGRQTPPYPLDFRYILDSLRDYEFFLNNYQVYFHN